MSRPPGPADRALATGSSPPLTAALCLLAALAAGAVAAGAVAVAEAPVDGWRMAARYTARLGFPIFLLVYVARPLAALVRRPATRWLLRNRRALGLAFASAHGVHLAMVVTFQITAARPPPLPTLVVAGGAYVILFAMVATSTDGAVRALGLRRWKRLHTVGIHWLWLVFALTYALGTARGNLLHAPLLAVALGALAVRIAAARTHRRAR